MIFAIIAQLFRRNMEARRARWFVFGACIGAFVIEAAYNTTIEQAKAADPDLCKQVGEQLGKIVMDATDDVDLQQAVAMSAQARCILMDEPPVVVRTEKAAEVAATPVAEPAPEPVTLSAKQQWCGKHFRSYRVSDGTVIRPGYRKRVACPWPG